MTTKPEPGQVWERDGERRRVVAVRYHHVEYSQIPERPLLPTHFAIKADWLAWQADAELLPPRRDTEVV